MSKKFDDHLETIDVGRRDAIRKIALGTAYVAPVVVSFAMEARSSLALAAPAPAS